MIVDGGGAMVLGYEPLFNREGTTKSLFGTRGRCGGGGGKGVFVLLVTGAPGTDGVE